MSAENHETPPDVYAAVGKKIIECIDKYENAFKAWGGRERLSRISKFLEVEEVRADGGCSDCGDAFYVEFGGFKLPLLAYQTRVNIGLLPHTSVVVKDDYICVELWTAYAMTKPDPGLADQVGYDKFMAINHKHVLEVFAQLGREVLRGVEHGAPSFYIRRKL